MAISNHLRYLESEHSVVGHFSTARETVKDAGQAGVLKQAEKEPLTMSSSNAKRDSI